MCERPLYLLPPGGTQLAIPDAIAKLSQELEATFLGLYSTPNVQQDALKAVGLRSSQSTRQVGAAMSIER